MEEGIKMLQFFIEPMRIVLIGVLGIALTGLALILAMFLVVSIREAVRFILYKCGLVKEPYWLEELKSKYGGNTKSG